MKLALGVALFAATTVPASAQYPDDQPERVTVEDLLRTPGRYNERLVLVKGRLRSGDTEDQSRNIYDLQDVDALRAVRVGQSYGAMNDLRFMEGQKVEVAGFFWDLGQQDPRYPDPRLRNFPGAFRSDTATQMDEKYRYFIGATHVESLDVEPPLRPEPKHDKPAPKLDLPAADTVDLRELVKSPDTYQEKRLAVVGKFRGDNLYGDLPIRTKKAPRDWVIKAATSAVWVTGRRPRGERFELDPKLRRDTGKWLKVSGQARLEDGVVYFRADTVEVVDKPDDPDLEPREIEKKDTDAPKVAPEVTFSLPIEGERGIGLTTEFRVQFSKDMNEASFDRNVDLLYADDPGRGNPFPDLKIAYDRASRTLAVNPGKPLEPGKEIRLALYKSIVDVEGLPLAVSPEAEAEMGEAAVLLVFFTATK